MLCHHLLCIPSYNFHRNKISTYIPLSVYDVTLYTVSIQHMRFKQKKRNQRYLNSAIITLKEITKLSSQEAVKIKSASEAFATHTVNLRKLSAILYRKFDVGRE